MTPLEAATGVALFVLAVLGIILWAPATVSLLKLTLLMRQSLRNLERITDAYSRSTPGILANLARAASYAAEATENMVMATHAVVAAAKDTTTGARQLAGPGQVIPPFPLSPLARGQIDNIRDLAGRPGRFRTKG